MVFGVRRSSRVGGAPASGGPTGRTVGGNRPYRRRDSATPALQLCALCVLCVKSESPAVAALDLEFLIQVVGEFLEEA